MVLARRCEQLFDLCGGHRLVVLVPPAARVAKRTAPGTGAVVPIENALAECHSDVSPGVAEAGASPVSITATVTSGDAAAGAVRTVRGSIFSTRTFSFGRAGSGR